MLVAEAQPLQKRKAETRSSGISKPGSRMILNQLLNPNLASEPDTLDAIANALYEMALDADLEGKPYLQSYPHLLGYLDGKSNITEKEVVRLAHMAYGWMPRILRVSSEKLPSLVDTLMRARCSGYKLTTADWQNAKATINNSFVGASKLLHFAMPEKVAIWDSRICTAITGRYRYSDINNLQNVMSYQANLQLLLLLPASKELNEVINEKLGYRVSCIRAMELAVFEGGETL